MNRLAISAIGIVSMLSSGVLAAATAAQRQVIGPAVAGDAMPETLRGQELRPLSLASADFDGDGVRDLAAGFATSDGGGRVLLYRGNVDALYPHSPEARQRRTEGRFVGQPFLPTERVLSLSAPPDFLFAGDFDADGHADLAAAAAGGTSIQFLPGDGAGLFGKGRDTPLPGSLTALAAGDIGRRDGLVDLVAAVEGASEGRAVILQAASGALSTPGTSVALPRSSRSIVIGAFGSSRRSVALMGEDGRVVFLKKDWRRAWKSAEAETREELDAATEALAFKQADGMPEDAAAVLTTRVGSEAARSSVVLRSDGSISAYSPAVAATFVVDVDTNLSDAIPGDGLCADSNGDCSLRAAIQEANAQVGADAISFAIPGAGVPQISLPGLPAVTETLTIDGTTQSAGRVAITGTSNGTLITLNASDCMIRGLVLNGTGNGGLRINGGGTIVEGNYFGTTSDGTAEQGNLSLSLVVASGDDNLIGGTAPAARNVISGSSTLIRLDGGTTTIQGNYVGTDATGTADIGGNFEGIRAFTAHDNTIGGAAPGAGNLVSGNAAFGIRLDTERNLVQGNRVGTDVSGSAPIPNDDGGIVSYFSTDNTIGGTAPGAGNLVSGNGGPGLELSAGGTSVIVNTLVEGNRIGTNADGTTAVPNQGHGIHVVGGTNIQIGGATAGARNIVSGNLMSGIYVTRFVTVYPTDVRIQGNFIGADATGTVPIPNLQSGVELDQGLGMLIGGTAPGEANLISGNHQHGIRFASGIDASSNPSVVLGNLIGTNAFGTGPLGNGQAGVYFRLSVQGWDIGGPAPGEPNLIAYNAAGVASDPGRAIRLRRNVIHSNGGLGVDRGLDGVTPNDPPGTFVYQNFPVLSDVSTSGSGTSVSGTLSSGYALTYTVHVFANPTCDPSGYGEAREYLGSVPVNTTAGAATPFSTAFPTPVPAGSYVTALAVASEDSPYHGASSELSFCRLVTGDPGPPDPVPLALFVVTPATGGNGGSVSLVVTGEGIAAGASVKLVRPGQPDVPGDYVQVADGGGNLRAIFNVGGAAPGLWDVVVTNPGPSTATLPGAFTIEEGGSPDLWVDIIGRSRILRGRETKFYLIYGNRGNVDAFFVPIWVAGIPLDATIDLKFGLIPQPQLPGLPPTDYASIPPILDTSSDRRVPLLIPIVPAGQTRVFLITIKTQQPTFALEAAIGEPWMQSVAGLRLSAPGGLEVAQAFIDDLTDCIATLFKTVFSEILDQLLPLDCVDLVGNVLASQLPNFFGNMLDASQATAGSDAEAFALIQSGTQVAQVAVTGAKCLADVGGAAFPPLLLAKAALDVLSEIEKYTEVILKCGPLIRDLVKHIIETVVPSDPNDKIGSLGVSEERWVGLEAGRYEILFENKPQATAPAHEVVITDQLDLTRFDLSTFSFGPVSFGEFAISETAPAGATEFTKDVDMRPTRNVIVRLSGGLDTATGRLTWHFHSLDPATMLPSEDPDQGFLPPNVSSPEGEGTVSFVVGLQPGLSSGTEYRNKATIIFDLEAPIETPEWLNTIDITAPTSHVEPLPTTSCSAIPLLWSGNDAHSGVRDYDLYVSDNGGPFTLWLAHRPVTSATFVGQAGHAYSFFSVARDHADNGEDFPASGDTSTNAANPSPVVDVLEPTSGAAAGGSTVALAGHGFLAGMTLSVGGAAATGVSVTDPQTAGATFPSLAAGTLHDLTATNTGGCGWSFPKAWFADFLDVDQAHPFHRFVENIFRKGITAGCATPGSYCPANPVTRAQMAVFLLKSKYGAAYAPPAATGVFGDVPPSNPFAPWIEQLATELITAGCSGGNYCPNSPVTRAQMAVFLLKSRYGPNLVPPPATGVFADVPVSSPFAPWIEQLAEEEITGGCGGDNYCPGNPVTRGQMAVFLTKTFGYVQ